MKQNGPDQHQAGQVIISVAVTAHPVRERLALDILTDLREFDPCLIRDPSPWDPPATLRTTARAWAAIAPGATHHLVLQEDIALIDGFASHLRDAVAAHPNHPIALFTDGTSRNSSVIRYAALTGARWAEAAPQYTPCQALVMPRTLVEGFVRFARVHCNPAQPDDEAMRAYLAYEGAELLLTVPNLVQHLPVRSLVGNDGAPRSAACLPKDLPSGWFLSHGAPVARYPQLPFLTEGSVGICLRRDPRGPNTPILPEQGWTIEEFEPNAHEVGINIDEAVTEYNAYLANQPTAAVRALFEDVPPRTLWSLWIAGYLCTAGSHLKYFRRAALPEGPDDTLIRESMRSLALGGLHPQVKLQDTSGHLWSRLGPVLSSGVERGRGVDEPSENGHG
ncbi:hypothetical protein ABZ635_08905 [Nocardiopsis sp. NPDC007018]|uniref:hypothetical protein n=1 Tax=Nocardiopsis sp. NPDC007018 TaxID=3155721 RepID=UPI0033EED0DA